MSGYYLCAVSAGRALPKWSCAPTQYWFCVPGWGYWAALSKGVFACGMPGTRAFEWPFATWPGELLPPEPGLGGGDILGWVYWEAPSCGTALPGGCCGLASGGGVPGRLELIGPWKLVGDDGACEAFPLLTALGGTTVAWGAVCPASASGTGLTPCQMSANCPLHHAMQMVGKSVAGTRYSKAGWGVRIRYSAMNVSTSPTP